MNIKAVVKIPKNPNQVEIVLNDFLAVLSCLRNVNDLYTTIPRQHK
jgi:hypothetical protein